VTLEDEIRALMTAEGKGTSTVEDYVRLADCQRRTVLAALRLILEEEGLCSPEESDGEHHPGLPVTLPGLP
jgi:hypothetical protein